MTPEARAIASNVLQLKIFTHVFRRGKNENFYFICKLKFVISSRHSWHRVHPQCVENAFKSTRERFTLLLSHGKINKNYRNRYLFNVLPNQNCSSTADVKWLGRKRPSTPWWHSRHQPLLMENSLVVGIGLVSSFNPRNLFQGLWTGAQRPTQMHII